MLHSNDNNMTYIKLHTWFLNIVGKRSYLKLAWVPASPLTKPIHQKSTLADMLAA